MRFEEGAVVFLVGNRGTGKSTLLAKLAQSFIRQKHEVYTNFEIQGCHTFETEQMGKVNFPENSVIMIDEVSILYNSRKFKTFDTDITEYIKECRKHHIMLVVASQNYNDTDKVWRDESNYLFMLYKYGRFTIGKRIINEIVCVPSMNGNSGYIGFDLHFSGFLTKGSRLICYRPLYYKYFDSWAFTKKKDLPMVKSTFVPYKKRRSLRDLLGIYLRPHKIK